VTGEAGVKRVALYLRVSTDEQAEHGYSIPEQRRELMAHAEHEGWRVVDVIEDDGYSGAVGVRPGLDRITTLAEAGEIDLVLAKKRNRFFRDRYIRMGYDRSLREYGVTLVALDDAGHRFADAMMDEFSDWYREEVAANTRAGRMQKAREGKLIASPRPTYGFEFTPDGEGYVVVPRKMAVVGQIMESIASGASIRGTKKILEREGVPAPMGGPLWSESAVSGIVFNDAYRPVPYAELAPMLTPEARSRLDEGGEYGVVWYPKLETKRGEPDPQNGYRRKRTEKAYAREEQIPIPVVSSGIPRELIDAARDRLANNVVSRTKSGRVFPLQGVLTCAGCGNNISSNHKKDGSKDYHYYRCQHYQRRGLAKCSMNRSFRAEQLERKVLNTVLDAVKDRDALIEKTNDTFEHEKANILRAGGADVAAWERTLDGLAEREARAQRAYMEGVISLDDLRARNAELDRERDHVKGLLAVHEGRAGRLKELEAARDKAIRQIKEGAWAELGITTPEARKERYREIGLSGELRADGTVVLQWGLGEEAVLRTNEPTSRGTGRPSTVRS
jgi:site-specific DNA recombinase